MQVHSGSLVGTGRGVASDGPYSPPLPLLPLPALLPDEPLEPLEPAPLALEPLDDEPLAPLLPEAAPEDGDAPPDEALEVLPVPDPQSFCAQAASVGLRLRQAARLFFSDEPCLPEAM